MVNDCCIFLALTICWNRQIGRSSQYDCDQSQARAKSTACLLKPQDWLMVSKDSSWFPSYLRCFFFKTVGSLISANLQPRTSLFDDAENQPGIGEMRSGSAVARPIIPPKAARRDGWWVMQSDCRALCHRRAIVSGARTGLGWGYRHGSSICSFRSHEEPLNPKRWCQ